MCSNHTKFSDGSDQFNVRFSFDEEHDSECHYLEKCCDPENIITESQSETTFKERFDKNAITECEQQCRADRISEEQRVPCGFRNKNGVGIEQTTDTGVAQFGEFPWMMALTEPLGSFLVYICGGSLIHPSVVLSGAHCVQDKLAKNLKVRAGEWDTQTENEPFAHSDHSVKNIIVHPNYEHSTLFNNVALLVLETPITLSAHINTVCLPPQNFRFDGTSCFGAGWGADNWESKGSYRVNLKKVELPAVPLAKCQDRLRSTKLGSYFKIHPSFMCAGGALNVDLCVGEFSHMRMTNESFKMIFIRRRWFTISLSNPKS